MSDGLQQFRAAVLPAWQDDHTAACAAAAEAMHAAVVEHADKAKGTVLIAVPHQPDVRAVVNYLTAFLTDAPQLGRVPHKIGTDEVTVAGKRILILPRVTSRRPRNILTKVDMAETVDVTPELKSDAEIARDVVHILLIEAHNEKIDPIALGLARVLAPDEQDHEGWIPENFGGRDDSRDEARWAEWRAAQKGLHRGSSLEDFQQIAAGKTSVPQIPRGAVPASPVGPDGYYTREYEQARMERVTQGGGMQQTRPITSKWRRN